MFRDALSWILTHYHDFGGSAFTQLAVGVNLALWGWKQFQDKLQWARRESEEASSKISANISDKSSEARAKYFRPITRFVSNRIIAFLNSFWRVVRALSIVAALYGIVALYCDIEHWLNFLLLLPIIAYLVSSCSLAAFQGVCSLAG